MPLLTKEMDLPIEDQTLHGDMGPAQDTAVSAPVVATDFNKADELFHKLLSGMTTADAVYSSDVIDKI